MQKHQSMIIPSHSVLSKLAGDDPEAFEVLRRELIEHCIESAPSGLQRRLYGLQFRVDCLRHLSPTPLGALVKIQTLMWESFLRMDQELQNALQLTQDYAHLIDNELDYAQPHSPGARIIAFKPRLPMKSG